MALGIDYFVTMWSPVPSYCMVSWASVFYCSFEPTNALWMKKVDRNRMEVFPLLSLPMYLWFYYTVALHLLTFVLLPITPSLIHSYFFHLPSNWDSPLNIPPPIYLIHLCSYLYHSPTNLWLALSNTNLFTKCTGCFVLSMAPNYSHKKSFKGSECFKTKTGTSVLKRRLHRFPSKKKKREWMVKVKMRC